MPHVIHKFTIGFIFLFLFAHLNAQIAYQYVTNEKFSFGSYGRVGVDWSFENGGSIGRRLNLNNMGSIGGRLEEQDYVEIAPAFHWKPKEGDNTIINVQMRLAVYSKSIATIGNSSTSSLGGLTFAFPELFAEARNIANTGVNVWVGSRLYRGADVHIADHFYFNDHSGQGFGIEFKKTRFTALFVSSTDTTATLPPYFYLNIETGTPSAALRQRLVTAFEHDIHVKDNQHITLLGEYHRMADADSKNIEIGKDSLEVITNFPSDYGLVIGARHHIDFKKMKGSFNDFTIRYGTRIANGGDGGLSRTYATFGAPDTVSLSFKGAYSLAVVNHAVFNFSNKNTLNPYVIFTHSKGGAQSNGLSPTYFGSEVYNRKVDLTIGARNEYYFNDYFHLITELHYSQRKDGNNPWASMVKLSVAPVYVPTGERNTWARPHLRFVTSVARYNDFAQETLYSPYLQFTGSKEWGYYFGVKAEWWIF
ncbi:carbohydrate porin [Namhaeicola litoreus]|uniref:Carbohydrate porin n=1 Tax=Namhaeicola litoreus TaxID=1052145 RepID=A0ABW3XY07_9FLAO